MSRLSRRQTPIHSRIRRPRLFAGLALVAIAALQLGTVHHESAHAIGDLTESCEICLKLDTPAAAESAFASINVLPFAAFDKIPLSSQVADRRPVHDQPPRAPPRA